MLQSIGEMGQIFTSTMAKYLVLAPYSVLFSAAYFLISSLILSFCRRFNLRSDSAESDDQGHTPYSSGESVCPFELPSSSLRAPFEQRTAPDVSVFDEIGRKKETVPFKSISTNVWKHHSKRYRPLYLYSRSYVIDSSCGVNRQP